MSQNHSMIPIKTERLTLRDLTRADFDAVHSYASFKENVLYMMFGPNSEDETRKYIESSMKEAEQTPRVDFELAIILNDTGELIGSCGLGIKPDKTDEAEMGWILHRNFWQQSFGPEAGQALLSLGFDELKMHRIIARCDAENYASYRVMEKIGMRKEGLLIEARPAGKLSPEKKYGDEFIYAITRDEWEIKKEISYYNSLPVAFDGFIDVPLLTDGEVYLLCYKKQPAQPEKNYVPEYMFAICKAGEKLGELGLRIGYTDGLYFGGQIGYGIDEKFRGNGYAVRACRLLAYIAKAHGMEKIIITNDYRNVASRRVCEKLGAKNIRLARLPEWTDLYREGQRFINIYEWTLE